jgi:hypothetical protein
LNFASFDVCKCTNIVADVGKGDLTIFLYEQLAVTVWIGDVVRNFENSVTPVSVLSMLASPECKAQK